MTGYVVRGDGTTLCLPVPLSWELSYTAGVPCDSFWIRCPWSPGTPGGAPDWAEFYAVEGEDRVFQGVVDECETGMDGQGGFLELSGRGMAARLLDNEALGQDYGVATLKDILRDHVDPYGLEVAAAGSFPAVSGFSVATGSSEWSVLYDFCRGNGGVTPRFDREGRLVLTPWPEEGEAHVIDDHAPVTALTCRDRRYGVCSEIWVRDRTTQAVEVVASEKFQAMGGRCRRILTMPGRSSYQTMRYTGQFQLAASAGELTRQEVTLSVPFCGAPGDLVRLEREGWPRNGVFRVLEATVGQSQGDGGWTRLELGEPGAVI